MVIIRKTVKRIGQCEIRKCRTFINYVFFSTTMFDLPMEILENSNGVIRISSHDNKDWKLTGRDAMIVSEIFNHNGLIGLSKGRFEDGRLRISEGFLKPFENEILRVDRRHNAAKIRFVFENQIIEDWFGYELEE